MWYFNKVKNSHNLGEKKTFPGGGEQYPLATILQTLDSIREKT